MAYGPSTKQEAASPRERNMPIFIFLPILLRDLSAVDTACVRRRARVRALKLSFTPFTSVSDIPRSDQEAAANAAH
jgi:hypothetical protein